MIMNNRFLLFIIAILTFSGTGLFAAPEFEWIRPEQNEVGLYEKFEVSFWMNADFENPFDPEDINVTATFTSPSGKTWEIPGFFSSVDSRNWLMDFAWFVRFSADETGEWSYVIIADDGNGKTSSETMKFTVSESDNPGPIRISSNQRYLEHDDGTPFFGVGLWTNNVDDPGIFDELKDKGVNFVSYVMTPLEAWTGGLGRYDQTLCEEVDRLLNNLEERDMYLALNMWFHSFLSETVWGGGNVRWFMNPYQTITSANDFYRSDEAWEYQEKLYRYMIARWGYSKSLAIWFIVDEVNGTDGWQSGDSTQAGVWVKKVHDYLKANDPWQHLTTGTRSGGIREWWQEAYEVLDMPGREIYEAQGFPINATGQIDMDETHPLTYSYKNYHGQVNKLWNNFTKPVVIPETGWDHVFYEMSMPGYQALFHNAMWVSLASGSAMSPFWWAYSDALNDNVVTNQLRGYRQFTGEIPFSKLTNLKTVEVKNSAGDAYAIGSDQLVFGWAVNSDTDMSGKTITIPEMGRGSYKLRLFHTWRGRFLENEDGSTERTIESKGRSVSFDIPILKVQGGHARYVGQDIAFILEPAD